MAPDHILPEIYQRYLNYYTHQVRAQGSVKGMQRILTGLDNYLQKSNTLLNEISIQQVDQFLALYNTNYSIETAKSNRSQLRQFLRYLYLNKYIKKDLAPLIVSPPEFGQLKPLKFLRTHEMQKVFDSLDLSTAKDLRTNAAIHLAYYLGLRPIEISSLTLDDISFRQKEILIRSRKNCSPAHLPLPDNIVKAITAYIVGGRPQSKHRVLFLHLSAPHRPVSKRNIPTLIRNCMRENNLPGNTYWLRHSFAQNMLESGMSIYEIKEMMGHKSLDSTKKYLSIHIGLMREIILDETF